ncbi:hypothetical protein ABZW02_15095 [Streptomyces sp. NPDC005180]|uniref:hypothetical protein n=1 Tax=Streptomyces sp. NPDC005180 TaxID=3156868 RepID=UPI0033AD03F4
MREGSASTATKTPPARLSGPQGDDADAERRRARTAAGGTALVGVAVVAVLTGPWLERRFGLAALGAWRTLLVAIVMQGVPFLVLGTIVSAAIGAFVRWRPVEWCNGSWLGSAPFPCPGVHQPPVSTP